MREPNCTLFMAQHYRALTRTYRPQTFDDIVSQEHVTSTLKNAIRQNRISHAYMFCGPRGVGKTTMARVLARAVNNISTDVDGESLNQTLNIVEMDAASNRKIEDVRQLKEVIRVPPQSGNYKIFIIDEVHMLTKEAFNALLKTLEEPPAHAIFIFATTEPHKVLPTILSRVQRFDFKRISVDEIVTRLKEICSKEQITIDDESLHVIAKKADGALRDALGLMDQAIAFCGTTIRYSELLQALNVIGHEQLFEFTDAVVNRDSNAGLQLIDRLMKEGADIQEYLVSLTEHIRNLYVAKQGERMHMVEATADTKSRYLSVAGEFSEDDLMRMLHLVSEAQLKIKDVQQPRVHFEILLLKLVHMGRSRELGELLKGLDELKKNGINRPAEDDQSLSENKESEPAPEVSEIQQSPAAEAHGTEAVSEKNSDVPDRNVRVSEPGYGEKRDDTAHQNASDNSSEAQQEAEADTPDEIESAQTLKAGLSQSESGMEFPRQSLNGQAGRDHDDINDEDDFLTPRPSLGFARGISSGNGGGLESSAPDVATAGEPDSDGETETIVRTISTAEDAETHWKAFLENIKVNAPQMLYFQMLRVQIRDLRGNELLLTADNEFASRLIDENQQMITSLFKEVSGCFLRLKCTVERNPEEKKESLSPYERFKELQKKDPKLRTIVELFGAELEY
jgi:DNA polymerase III subunit gamma/tau